MITGATGGIGSVTAKLFAKLGAQAGLCGRDEKKLKSLVDDINKGNKEENREKNEDMKGGMVTEGENEYTAKSVKNADENIPPICSFVCDLASEDEVSGFIDKADEVMGGIDILICNAGVTRDMLAIRMNNEDFDYVLDINLRTTFHLNRDMLKKMLKRRYGRIINISSIVGIMGNGGQANYVASKAGMIGMSKTLAQEVATRNITVNCVAPGFIETPMTAALTEEQKNKMLASIPVGRLGLPEDVANAIVFLAAKESNYITGQTLHVNGGMLMV